MRLLFDLGKAKGYCSRVPVSGKGIDPNVAARSLWLESHPLPIGQEEPTSTSWVQAGP